MLAYATIGVNDLDKATDFYTNLLEPMGAKVLMDADGGRVKILGTGSGPMLGLAKPFNGEPAAPGNGNMVAIACDTAEQVKAMHARALEFGATDEGEPGPRGGGAFSCGYIRDPEGNKLNFFCTGA